MPTKQAAPAREDHDRMHPREPVRGAERWARSLRHAPLLRRADGLWNALRPPYERWLEHRYPEGLPRELGDGATMRVSARSRSHPVRLEAPVWAAIRGALDPGDTFVDVGAFIGAYSVAAARVVGRAGRVLALEPAPASHQLLLRHLQLNGVADRVRALPVAAGDADGDFGFEAGWGTESRVVEGASGRVPTARLDSVLAGDPADVIKIDVEGFEARVLAGSQRLLADPARAPRRVVVELHPYNWAAYGSSADDLRALLEPHGYRLTGLDGASSPDFRHYGHLVADRGAADPGKLPAPSPGTAHP